MFKLNHVIWYYTFGVSCKKRFSRSHTHILHLGLDKNNFTANTESVQVMSARKAVYNDKRAAPSKMPDNTWALLKHQLEAEVGLVDTWVQSRICGTFSERNKVSPNQIPIALLDRIILYSSNKGDLVVDPFVGSGSSALSAKKNGRKFLGADISRACIDASIKRLEDQCP